MGAVIVNRWLCIVEVVLRALMVWLGIVMSWLKQIDYIYSFILKYGLALVTVYYLKKQIVKYVWIFH